MLKIENMKFKLENFNLIRYDLGEAYDDFWAIFEIEISRDEDYGAEAFSVNIVSVARLKKIAEGHPLLGKGIIICKDYDETAIRDILDKLIRGIDVDNWDDFCFQFEKYFERL